MIIPGSDVRAEALMRGQLDATPAEIGDVLNILSAKPGQFHVLISYAKTFPQLIGSMYFARADYVQKNSATVESVLEAILRTHRSAEERPASVKENALRLLPETKPELNRSDRRDLQRATHLGRQRRRRAKNAAKRASNSSRSPVCSRRTR